MKPIASVIIFIISCFNRHACAQHYQAGDIIDNFTLTDYYTADPVKLSDFDGKIVVLEWFAWWCPFCQNAAEETEVGIAEYYKIRNGNPAGIDVVHVAINLQAGQDNFTNQFIENYNFEYVLNDTDRSVADRFQFGGQPIFAIINMANSNTHEKRELLLHQDGYGNSQNTFNELIKNSFRPKIDAVALAADGIDFAAWVLTNDLVVDGNGNPHNDPDRDGIPNLLEFAFGLNPWQADAATGLEFLTDPVQENRILLKYLERDDLIGLEYNIVCSTDLVVWEIYRPDESRVSREPLENRTRITVPILLDEEGPRKYFAIQAELSPP